MFLGIALRILCAFISNSIKTTIFCVCFPLSIFRYKGFMPSFSLIRLCTSNGVYIDEFAKIICEINSTRGRERKMERCWTQINSFDKRQNKQAYSNVTTVNEIISSLLFTSLVCALFGERTTLESEGDGFNLFSCFSLLFLFWVLLSYRFIFLVVSEEEI